MKMKMKMRRMKIQKTKTSPKMDLLRKVRMPSSGILIKCSCRRIYYVKTAWLKFTPFSDCLICFLIGALIIVQ